jgi:outer membrane cobalamin receptor
MKRLILVLLLFLPATAIAEEGGEQTLEPIVVEETRVEPPLGYPSAFSTAIELKDFGGEYNTASELLSFSPGVVVRDFGGFGQLKTLSIRGSSNDQVVILLDGVRINSPLGGGVDLSTIPLDYVERFEIIRGGASALAGSDAIGGVVNIVTKKTDKPFTNLSLTYGSFDTLSLNLSRAQRLGNLRYLLSFTHAQSDGDFKFKSVNDITLKRINNEFHSESLLGKIDYDLNGWKIGFLNEFFYDDKGVPGLGEFQESESNQKDIRNLTSLRVSKQGLLSPNLDFDMVLFNRFDQIDFKNPEPTLGIPIDTLSKTFSFGVNPKITWYAPFDQIVTFASEIRGDVLRNDDFKNPERFTLSSYLGDEIRLFRESILINPIIRFDLFKTSAEEVSTDAELSPKLGIIVSPLRYLSLKGNVGRSFRVPSFGELFFPEEGFIGGNPDLNPETSFDLDFGLVLSHPRVGFEITYFRNRIDDLILFVFISAQRIEPRNVGKVTERGIEASLVLRPFDFFEFFAGYTFLDGELEDTGAQLPGRPKNKFDIRGVLRHRSFSLFWETHFVDRIPLGPFPNSATTDARTTHDIGGKVEWKRFFLTFEAKNVLNNLDVRDALDFPLPGRTVFFTAGVNF